MLEEIKAPEEMQEKHYGQFDKLFLAGGITDCEDWQRVFINKLKLAIPDDNLLAINPRYEDYSYSEKKERLQVYWEAKHMELSDAIVFWFLPPTKNPITLFELGISLNVNKKLFIGIHPDYDKKNNVMSQLFYQNNIKESKDTRRGSINEMLSDIDNTIVSSTLDHLAARVINWRNGFSSKN